MKKRTAKIAAVVAVLIVIQYGTAQVSATKLNTTEKIVSFTSKNLLSGLQSGNRGVMESAMRITAQMKLRYPSADVSSLLSVINDIRENHPSGCTRYKAYLAVSICSNPEWYVNDAMIAAADEETFFHAASDRLQQQLLSVNTQ